MNKKRITFAMAPLAFAATLFFGNSASATCPYGEMILYRGTTGNEVALLQNDLQTLGYLVNYESGVYGDSTEIAVENFQKRMGFEVNGEVGMTTGPMLQQKAALLRTAKNYVGVPYQWGGTTPNGFDCSGFVRYVFNHQGKGLPRTAESMYEAGTPIKSAMPGDLVFFSTYDSSASHVGIYLGGNRFISATDKYGVHIDSFSNPYWGPRYLGAKRFD